MCWAATEARSSAIFVAGFGSADATPAALASARRTTPSRRIHFMVAPSIALAGAHHPPQKMADCATSGSFPLNDRA